MNTQTCPKCGKKSYKNMEEKRVGNNINALCVATNFVIISTNLNG